MKRLVWVFLRGVGLASSLRASQAQSEPQVSTEDLFDLLVPNNIIEEEEEAFPVLSVVDHYAVSWSAVLSFSEYEDDDAGNVKLSSPTLNQLFWDHQSQFKYQLHMSCPLASRLVVGLIDDQGQRQRPPRNPKGHLSIQDAISCGPPIDMSRNVLECRGIPGGDAQPASKDALRYHQRHQFIFEAYIEVTCMGYATSLETEVAHGNYKRSSANNASRKTNDSLLGLNIYTPKQQQIKPKANLVLTESFHATRITNLTQYLEPSVYPLYEMATDATGFTCQRGIAVDSNNHNNKCAKGVDSTGMDSGGLCTRQSTCYYSALSATGSCTLAIESLVLSSGRKQKRRLHGARRKHKSRNLTPIPLVRPAAPNARYLISKKRFRHQARYRLLWSAFNFGCEGFPIMMDISCSNAAGISYQGSSAARSHLAAIEFSNRNGRMESQTYWDGTGFDSGLLADQQDNFAGSSLECYQSLFLENTIHCRRTMPDSSSSETLQYYQEVLALDIVCVQEVDNPEEIQRNIIHANTLEASNIQCSGAFPRYASAPSNQSRTRHPTQLGSALTIVPVTMQQNMDSGAPEHADGDSENEVGTNSSSGSNNVLFPPPHSGSTIDPTTSVKCPSCQNNYDFYINYYNSIGNKVAQLVKGCLTTISCHDISDNPERCINTFPTTTITYQDQDASQFLSQLYPIPSQSPNHGSWKVAMLTAIATAVALWMGG